MGDARPYVPVRLLPHPQLLLEKLIEYVLVTEFRCTLAYSFQELLAGTRKVFTSLAAVLIIFIHSLLVHLFSLSFAFSGKQREKASERTRKEVSDRANESSNERTQRPTRKSMIK